MKRVKNFTMIELLVVVAVIAILMGMLLPALNKARAKARQISCVSNLKQVQQCLLFYVSDYGESLPPFREYEDGKDGWYHAVYFHYMKIKKNHSKGTIAHCPEIVMEQRTWGFSSGFFVVSTNRTGFIGYQNDSLWLTYTGSGSMFKPAGYVEPLNSGRIKSPSTASSFSDGKGGHTAYAYTQTFDARHLGGANFAFFDGHVAFLKPLLPFDSNPYERDTSKVPWGKTW